MGYKVQNPTSGNVYFDTTGSAVGSNNQPKVKGGAVYGTKNSSLESGLLDGISPGVTTERTADTVYRSERNGYREVLLGSSVVLISVADDGDGFCEFTKAAHGLSVGDVIYISGSADGNVDGVHVLTDVDTNTFVTDRTYVVSSIAGSYKKGNANFATMVAGEYIARRVTTKVAGNPNDVLQSGASDYGQRRSIHKREAVRTRRIATAIRAGYWNEYSGTWSTDPTVADDASFMNLATDGAATPSRSVPGELVYKESKPLPVMDDYKPKTA